MSPLDPTTASKLATALASGPTALFAELSTLFTSIAGVRTATFIAVAPDRTVTHRIGTSNPTDFPVGNVDPVDDTAWNRAILGDMRPLIGDSVEGMASFLPETDALVAMGYAACACFPIVIAGETARCRGAARRRRHLHRRRARPHQHPSAHRCADLHLSGDQREMILPSPTGLLRRMFKTSTRETAMRFYKALVAVALGAVMTASGAPSRKHPRTRSSSLKRSTTSSPSIRPKCRKSAACW